MPSREFIFWLASLLLALLAALATPQVAAQHVAAAEPAAADSYRISRGDELNLRFFYTPELNTTATVRSDGRISVLLLGEVSVEGLTVAELGRLLESRLAPQVNRPQVSINVQGATTQRVFVGGEVARAGMQPLAGPLTVLQAVMVAEGLKDTAQPSQVLVLRRDAQGRRQVLSVDLDAALSGRDASQDIALQAFDVVVVPRSGIADVGRWVDLYIRRVLPFSVGFSYTNDRTGVSR